MVPTSDFGSVCRQRVKEEEIRWSQVVSLTRVDGTEGLERPREESFTGRKPCWYAQYFLEIFSRGLITIWI